MNQPPDTARAILMRRAADALGAALYPDEWTGEDLARELSYSLPLRIVTDPDRYRIQCALYRTRPDLAVPAPPEKAPPLTPAPTPSLVSPIFLSRPSRYSYRPSAEHIEAARAIIDTEAAASFAVATRAEVVRSRLAAELEAGALVALIYDAATGEARDLAPALWRGNIADRFRTWRIDAARPLLPDGMVGRATDWLFIERSGLSRLLGQISTDLQGDPPRAALGESQSLTSFIKDPARLRAAIEAIGPADVTKANLAKQLAEMYSTHTGKTTSWRSVKSTWTRPGQQYDLAALLRLAGF